MLASLPFPPVAILKLHEFYPCSCTVIRNKMKPTSHVVCHENRPEKERNKIYKCLIPVELEILHDFLVENCNIDHPNHENQIQHKYFVICIQKKRNRRS